MFRNIDLIAFQARVNEELRAFDIPGENVQASAREQLQSPPPEIGIPSLLPLPMPGLLEHREETLPEQFWRSRLTAELHSVQESLLIELVALEPDNEQWRREQVLLKTQEEAMPETLGRLWQERHDASEARASELVSDGTVRTRLCAALRTVSDDAFEIAKITTPILVGLATAGTVSIPLLPVLFAAVALVIARMGIASFCPDDKNEKDSK